MVVKFTILVPYKFTTEKIAISHRAKTYEAPCMNSLHKAMKVSLDPRPILYDKYTMWNLVVFLYSSPRIFTQKFQKDTITCL